MNGTPLYVSLALFAAYATGLIVVGIGRLGAPVAMASAALGVLSFTLVEYLVHRHVFHMAARSERAQRLRQVLHGSHHEDPDAWTNMMMRPTYAVAALAVLSAVMLPWGDVMLGVGPGFIAGYGGYLWLHFAYHAYPRPRGLLGGLWAHHELHHTVDSTCNYGVSSPLWDVVLGTSLDTRA